MITTHSIIILVHVLKNIGSEILNNLMDFRIIKYIFKISGFIGRKFNCQILLTFVIHKISYIKYGMKFLKIVKKSYSPPPSTGTPLNGLLSRTGTLF